MQKGTCVLAVVEPLVLLVQWVDGHAIRMLLLLLLAAACMLRWRAQGRAAWLWQDRRADPRPGGNWLLAVAGLAAIALALLIIGVQQSQSLQPQQGLMALDLKLQNAVSAGLPPSLQPLVRGWTMLGDLRVMGLLGLVVGLWLLWRRQGLQLLGWVVAVAGTGLWVRFLKATMQRERPLDGLVHEAGFSFPSGHSAGTAAIFGMLAWLVARRLPPRWRAWVFAAAVLLALSTGLSRVLLSVHHASDVLAGLCLGLGWTALVLWLTDRVEHGGGALRAVQAEAQLPLR
ncbi:phosphoesterase PA-phosphatase [Comamonas testosteroni TK102]|jgi:undecaprenyl-diphosphatase|uniref:Phosphoesterase PA-phosphatase n=1 Tax=Comamonas testosteroni TK102 TaxID=1392005 RepID=A0A076PR95_COMTE|nr:phosphoesterase PA-phosphatase [Comamonas testosteroni TK102]MPS89292.1 phosphatase PAP2 family protein [Comamonas sp.]